MVTEGLVVDMARRRKNAKPQGGSPAFENPLLQSTDRGLLGPNVPTSYQMISSILEGMLNGGIDIAEIQRLNERLRGLQGPTVPQFVLDLQNAVSQIVDQGDLLQRYVEAFSGNFPRAATPNRFELPQSSYAGPMQGLQGPNNQYIGPDRFELPQNTPSLLLQQLMNLVGSGMPQSAIPQVPDQIELPQSSSAGGRFALPIDIGAGTPPVSGGVPMPSIGFDPGIDFGGRGSVPLPLDINLGSQVGTRAVGRNDAVSIAPQAEERFKRGAIDPGISFGAADQVSLPLDINIGRGNRPIQSTGVPVPDMTPRPAINFGQTSPVQALSAALGINLGGAAPKQSKKRSQTGAGVPGYTGGGPAEAALLANMSQAGKEYGGLPVPSFTSPSDVAQYLMLQQNNPALGQQFSYLSMFGPDWQQAMAADQGAAVGMMPIDQAQAEALARAQAQARAAALVAAYRRQMASLGTTIDAATATGTQAADAALSAVRANPSPYQNIQLAQAQDATNPLANYMRQLGTSTQQADATLGLLNQMNQTQNAGLSQLATNLGTINQNAQNGTVNDIERSKQAFIQQLAQQRAAEELALKNYYGSRGVRV